MGKAWTNLTNQTKSYKLRTTARSIQPNVRKNQVHVQKQEKLGYIVSYSCTI